MVDVLENSITTLTDAILYSLISIEMREGFMVNFLRPYLLWQAPHFCHEFYNFVSSSYDIPDYDRFVRFTIQPRTEYPRTIPPLRREDVI